MPSDPPLFRRVPPMHALAAFEAAARLGGFAPAADELCVTPSAVSHRIRQLERQLDMQLFERTPTGVKLTTSGRMYLARVREAFVSLARPGDGSPARARLRVSIPPTFARQLFMPRLPAYLATRPDLDLEVHVTNSLAAAHDEPVDVSIIWSDGANLSGVAHRLFDEAIGPLAAPGMIAEWGLGEAADLAKAPLLRTPLLPWAHWFQAAGLNLPEPDRGASFNDLGMLLEAASVGLGVALCSRRLAAQWIEAGRLVPISDVTAVPPHSYYVTCDSARMARPEVLEFVDWLREEFAS
ncbi:LysR substrate-binding domain-containing protein [Nitrogeniibacter aestuarii]|uniref:LysR substrate-binding domain-containing protein n=1 Tax=Nitrogeniibacter aestuarii TaxID=2815343 RepID=UPI001D104383|nr:LysR substrate-binding domain-containing protein [Nitrogeniibacter aestuarii]